MFGRRGERRLGRILGPFRRQTGPLRPALELDDPLRQALQDANRLKDAERYGEAAELFEHLGYNARQRGMLRRSPLLYLQAAECRFYARQPAVGMALMKQGFQGLAAVQDRLALRRIARRAQADLLALGYPAQADELRAWLHSGLPGSQVDALDDAPAALGAEPGAPERPPARLPAKCPYCGASLRADEVEWIDPGSAECPYCGSAVPA